MFIRTSFVYKFSYNNDMQIQSNGNYLITEDFMGHIMLEGIFQVLGFIITLSTFIFSLMYYRRQEKKFMGEETC